MKANLTLEDIGRLAGVSRSTVSRVINDQASVRPDVRERVRDVIRRTGYTPNAAARSLVSGRTGLVGLVIPSRVHSLFEDPYFGRLIQGVSAGCNESKVSLTLFLFQNETEEEALFPRVADPGLLDGLILTATRMQDPLLARLALSDMPVVVIGRPDVADVSYVDVDNFGGAKSAASFLCDNGYRRIGLIGAPTDTTAGLDRLAGFVQGLAERGQHLDPRLRVDGDFSQASGYHAMRQLLPHKPEAIFAASDTMAIGAMRALREAGLTIPGDIGIVGFDGSPSSETSDPPLTTVRQRVFGTGARAVDILNRIIDRGHSAPIIEIEPVDLVIRASTADRT